MVDEIAKLREILSHSKCKPIDEWLLPVLQRLQEINIENRLYLYQKDGCQGYFYCLPTSIENLLYNLHGKISDDSTVVKRDFIQGFRKWITVKDAGEKFIYTPVQNPCTDKHHHRTNDHLLQLISTNQSFQALIDEKKSIWDGIILKKIAGRPDLSLQYVLDLFQAYFTVQSCEEIRSSAFITKEIFDRLITKFTRDLVERQDMVLRRDRLVHLENKLLENSDKWYNYLEDNILLLNVVTHFFNTNSCGTSIRGYSDRRILDDLSARYSLPEIEKIIARSFESYEKEFLSNTKRKESLAIVLEKNDKGETCTPELLEEYKEELAFFEKRNMLEVFVSGEILINNVDHLNDEIEKLARTNNSIIDKWLVDEVKDKVNKGNKKVILDEMECPHCGGTIDRRILEELKKDGISECEFCNKGITLQ
ncbi:MAG: hypothetical protein ACFFD4_23570 [Candidatus Odinarchaeota archaeon]